MDDDEPKRIDLTLPADCREFLNELHVNGLHVKKFYTSTGRTLTVAEMTDKEAVAFANQIHQEMFDGADEVDMGFDTNLN